MRRAECRPTFFSRMSTEPDPYLACRAGSSLTSPCAESRLAATTHPINLKFQDTREQSMRINHAAVLVCAAAYWLLGGLWYGLLFGPRWMALEKLTIEQGKSMNSALRYVVTLVLDLLIAYALAQLCSWRKANTAGRGAAIGVLLWIGIVAPITYTTHMYEMRPMELFAINELYPLVGLCLMGAVLGAWTKKNA
jgi:Protein of unknown function (DUF1761)